MMKAAFFDVDGTLYSHNIGSILDCLAVINDNLKVKTNAKTYSVFSELSRSEAINAFNL